MRQSETDIHRDVDEVYAPVANDLGGPVKYNSSLHQKYEFTGTTAANLGNPSYWTASNADAAGSAPATLGYVNSTFYYNAYTQRLALNCCSYSEGEGKRAHNTNQSKPDPTGIKAYPNPASAMLYFEFPASVTTTIKLMDVTGRTMNAQTIHNNTMATFSIKGYTPGLYLYQVTNNGKTQSGKILVEQ